MENDIMNRWNNLLTRDADDIGSTSNDTDDTSSASDDGSVDEVLYKMIDGERMPCTPEETAKIKARWAQAAIDTERHQQIKALKAQDMSTSDKIQCLMSAVNALVQGQTIPSDLANKIASSCQIHSQIEAINNIANQ
jgi:hypothetical protein